MAEKLDPDVVEELLLNIDISEEKVVKSFRYFKKQVRKCKTVDQIMLVKRDFLYTYVMNLPIKCETCYFCLKGYDCKVCPYGENHGICDIDSVKKHGKLPTWVKIYRAYNRLASMILYEFYNEGEFGDD